MCGIVAYMIQKLLLLTLFLGVIPFVGQAQSTLTYKAEVVDILSTESKQLEGFEVNTTSQLITISILEGPQKDVRKTFSQDKFEVKKGEIIFVQELEGGAYQVLEKNRMPMIFSLLGIFVILILILNGFQGLKSVLGLVLSFGIIIFVLLPLVIAGFNPLLVSIIVGALILSAVLYLSHGFNRGSTLALLGTLGAIICAGLLSLAVSYWMKLTGLGDDESLNALIVTKGVVNFSDLLLAGIIVGMLGVLDDIAITQVAVVSEIKKANAHLSPQEVFIRALRVGKEHISALVNTLVLAYTGASFPLLILLYQSDVRLEVLLSQEIVSGEIVRTLVGSIGLIIAVPLTTYLAVRYLKSTDCVETNCGHTHH